MGITIYRF